MKRIAIITSSRAEWGLLEPLAIAIANDAYFELEIIITGSHLSPEFGITENMISNAKWPPNSMNDFKKIEILLSSDTNIGTCKSMGLALISFADLYTQMNPDMIIVLGDRFEILAATIAAYNMHIPITHIHGGEMTEGSLDDAYRHSITHMSRLHFTAHANYRQKVMELGKDPKTVFNVGCLALQDLPKPIYPKNKEQIIFLWHPETILDEEANKKKFDLIIDMILEEPFKKIYAIGSNADCGGIYINDSLKQIAKTNDAVIYLPSIRRSEFLELLNESIAIIGNSSCGIYEAPALGTATINIGIRQNGRLKASSILHYSGTLLRENFRIALDILYSDKFQNSLKNIYMPYHGSDVSIYIIQKIKDYFNTRE